MTSNLLKTILTLLMAGNCRHSYSQTDFSNAPQWQITLNVKDEIGNVISNATATIGYYVPPPPNQTEAGAKVTALTDTNGMAVLTAKSGPTIGYIAEKAGYYPAIGKEFRFDYQSGTNGMWKPWNPVFDVVLKRISNPIPMNAKSVNLGMPAFDKAVGYDLLQGDWVSPFGKGVSPDILFSAHNNQRSRQDYEYKLTVSFSNPGDGIQPFTPSPQDRESSFLSPYQAPLNDYQAQWVSETINHPNEPFKDGYDPKRNYFIRVRTVLDDKGNIKSALYGKIYGDFMQFTYYLNPTQNDRNIEFDPRHNLISNLDSSEAAKLP